MGFKFRTVRLPFLRIRDGKAGRTLTWHLGAWSYNSRTGQHAIKLGKNVRWETKTAAQRAKRKPGRYTAAEAEALARAAGRKDEKKTAQQKAKAAQKATERRQWQQKIAAGQVEGLRVPVDVTSASGPRSGAARRGARSGGRSGAVVHPVTPRDAAARAEQWAMAAQEARQDAQDAHIAERLRAGGVPEARIGALIEVGRRVQRTAEADRRRGGSETNAATLASDPAGPTAAGDAPGHADGSDQAGLCGAPTQDGTPCRNAKGGCPHHRNNNRNGGRSPARGRRRRS